MSKDEKSRMAYEAREAEIYDQMTRIKTAKKLLAKGFDIDLIIEMTELDKVVVHNLSNGKIN